MIPFFARKRLKRRMPSARGNEVRHNSRTRSWSGWLLLVALTGTAGPAGAEDELFPQPFAVEHRLVQVDQDGRFEGDQVVDTYLRSSIVSERPDGSRLVIDLVRREMTEIRPQDGVYWSIDFDRFAALRARLAQIAGPKPKESPSSSAVLLKAAGTAAAPAAEPAFEVEEVLAMESGTSGSFAAPDRELRTKSASGEGSLLPVSQRHFVVKTSGQESAAIEVWVDPARRFSPAASAALARFEADAFTAPSRESSGPPLAKALAAVRSQSGAALALRTVRPLFLGSRQVGTLATEVLAVRNLDSVDEAKLRVPEGLRRRPHPLELALQQLEQEERINDALAGKSQDLP